MDVAARRVEVDRHEPQPALHRALDAAQALHLLERHPGRHAPEAAARRDDVAVVAAPTRGCGSAAGSSSARAAAGAGARLGRAGEDPREQVERERPRLPTGSTATQLLLVAGALALALLLAGDVDLEAAPAERTPEQRLDMPHGLHAARPDRLGGQRDEPAAQAEAVRALRRPSSRYALLKRRQTRRRQRSRAAAAEPVAADVPRRGAGRRRRRDDERDERAPQ